jgi:hypothetical protein
LPHGSMRTSDVLTPRAKLPFSSDSVCRSMEPVGVQSGTDSGTGRLLTGEHSCARQMPNRRNDRCAVE